MSKRIGYWSAECDPHTFIDPTWDPAIRDSVIQRLQIATPFAQWLGYASCRCCSKWDNGSQCMTFDGSWVWPEGFVHYIEDHLLRVPQEFIDYLLGVPPELVAELTHHQETLKSLLAEWEPQFKGSTCPQRGTGCAFTDKGEGKIDCKTTHPSGGGVQAHSCQWATRSFHKARTDEVARHQAALDPWRVCDWEVL